MMAVVMMSAITDDDLFRASAMPTGPGLCLQAGAVAAAAGLAAHLAVRRLAPGLTARWQAPFRLRCLPGSRSVFSKGR